MKEMTLPAAHKIKGAKDQMFAKIKVGKETPKAGDKM
jgi:hypothetical protein